MKAKKRNNLENGTIAKLENLARGVLDKFPVIAESTPIARRPFFIEFSGTPKSGKTTAATRLELFLRRNGFRTRTLVERASTCPIRRKDHMFFNTWTACTTLAQMLEALERDDQVVIVDRGLFDAMCWMQWLEKTGRLKESERKIIDEFVRLDRWRNLMDIVFFFSVSPQVALERELAGQLTKRPGSIMNESTLKQFNDSMEAVSKREANLFRRMIRIDTTSADVVGTVERIAAETLENLQDFLGERILVLNKKAFETLAISGGFFGSEETLIRLRNILSESCEFTDRANAESSTDYVQPIPIAYFHYGDKYLLLRRSEEDHKNRIHEKYVIWAGGHVRDQDGTGHDAIKECLRRELDEELFIKNFPEPELVGIVYDTSSTASCRHVGLVYRIALDQPDVVGSINGKEFKERRGKSVSGTFVDRETLLRYFDNMEGWSQMILVEHLKLAKRPISQQTLLF